MTGEQYSKYIQEKMKVTAGHKVSGIGIIQPNPAAGKHLLTATLRIDDIPIDITNLRSDDYCSTNENKVGTPLEDANRRDFTVNSMFYNINEDKIEDFTQKGIDDLKDKVIRTPISAKETLNDDPLRSLRAIRFSSKLGFRIDSDLEEVMKSEYIRNMMAEGISKERIKNELIGALETGRIGYCIEKLVSCNLLQAILGDVDITNVVAITKSYQKYCELMGIEINPFSCFTIMTLSIYGQVFNKKQSLIDHLMIENFKLSTKEKNMIMLMHNGINQIKIFVENEKTERLNYARILQAGEQYWIHSLLIYCAIKSPINTFCPTPDTDFEGNYIMKPFIDKMIQAIDNYHLDQVWLLKPLINGSEISEIYKKKSGPWVRDVLANELDYQISHPEALKEEVLEHIRCLLNESM